MQTRASPLLSSFLPAVVRSSSSKSDTFYPARHGSFSQAQPNLYNPFIEDAYLRHYLSYKLPNEVTGQIEYHLIHYQCV